MMLEAAWTLFQDATRARALLLINHVLAAEPLAVARLQPWAGRMVRLELEQLPGPMRWVVTDPGWTLQVTDAGLLEAVEGTSRAADAPADLYVAVDASNPMLIALQAASGARPTVRVEGDAAFAADVGWLIDNLRWHIEDDLAQTVSPMAAHQLGQLGRLIGPGIAQAAAALAAVVGRFGEPGAGRFNKAPARGEFEPDLGPKPR